MGASNFSSLRANRQKALEKLNQEIQKESSKQGKDERFWTLTVDQKTKIGYAKLRFLPEPPNEDVPWQFLYVHAFKHIGAWFIENCPTTKGRTCPVCAENNKLWEAGGEGSPSRKLASARKRTKKFISNVLVLEDPAHPENVGKVMLFKYGKKIFEKIEEKTNPKYPGEIAYSPFDLYEGADFRLKSGLQGDFQSYDKSEFPVQSELFPGDDAAKEEVWNKQYPLLPFVADDQFKSYEDLEKRLKKVLSGNTGKTAEDVIKAEQPSPEVAQDAAAALDEAASAPAKPTARKPRSKPAPKVEEVVVQPDTDDADVATPPEDEDDIRDFFADVLK